LIDLFFSFKKSQGLADRTLEDYVDTFDEFKNYYPGPEINEDIIEMKLYEYFTPKATKAPATFNRPYSNLLCFFSWCQRKGYLKCNPLVNTELKKKRDEGTLRHVDENILKLLIASFDLTTYSGLRNYALIILTLDTGIRPNEALNLTVGDYMTSKIKIRREVAKNRTERILPLSASCSEILKRLISYKDINWPDYLFLTSEGNKMSVNRWEKILELASKRIGHKVTPYMLRHSFAIMFLRNGGNVFALQQEMGHSDMQMTKRYLKLTQVDIQQQHSKASPLNNIIKRTTRLRKILD
jgi:site-specific recombinase XerD